MTGRRGNGMVVDGEEGVDVWVLRRGQVGGFSFYGEGGVVGVNEGLGVVFGFGVPGLEGRVNWRLDKEMEGVGISAEWLRRCGSEYMDGCASTAMVWGKVVFLRSIAEISGRFWFITPSHVLVRVVSDFSDGFGHKVVHQCVSLLSSWVVHTFLLVGVEKFCLHGAIKWGWTCRGNMQETLRSQCDVACIDDGEAWSGAALSGKESGMVMSGGVEGRAGVGGGRLAMEIRGRLVGLRGGWARREGGDGGLGGRGGGTGKVVVGVGWSNGVMEGRGEQDGGRWGNWEAVVGIEG
ncbi:hypothetical protein Tco_1155936 [Tanacetum coccineum]